MTEAESTSRSNRSGPRGRLPLLAGLAALAIVIAVTSAVILRDPQRPPALPENWRWGSLAVLPFQPEAGSAGEAWIGELLTRAAERGAQEQRGVAVQQLPRAELLAAREGEPPELALPLQATRLGRLTSTPWIVTGTFNVHQREGKVLASVSIIRARDGQQVGAFTRVGHLKDPEALGQSVAEGMARPLLTLFQGEEPLEMGRELATNAGAREAFLEAHRLFAEEQPVKPDTLDRVQALLERALQLQPELLPARRLDLQARLSRHTTSGDPGDLAQAIAAAEWLREATGAPDASLQLCRLHRLTDDLPRALAACEAARKQDPERTPYLALAELLFEFGRDKDAGALLEEGLERQPHVGWLFLAAARRSIERGLHDQTELMVREAIKLQDAEIAAKGDTRAVAEGWPPLNGAHGLLARVQLHRGKDAEAAAEARKEIEQLRATPAPDSPEALLEAGLILRLAGKQLDDEAAMAEGREAEAFARNSLLGDSPGAAEYLRAAWTYGGDDAPEALALCRKGLQLEPEHPALNRLAAIVASRTGADKDARDFIARAVQARAKKCPPCAEAYRTYILRAIEKW